MTATHGHHEHPHETVPLTTGRVIRWARWYDLFFGRKTSAAHKQVLDAAEPKPGEKALDVGCGPGMITIILAGKVGREGEAVGIDAGVEMIEVARKKAKREKSAARFEAAAIESLPFPDASFDLATSTFMLHHLPEDVKRKGIAEIRRVLNSDGRFVIADFSSADASLGIHGFIASLLGHKHGSSSFPALETMLREGGFSQVEQLESKRKGTMVVRAS